MSTDPREFEHPIDGTGGTVTPLVEVIAEALAYEHCKRVNPKADHPIMGYHTFHPDQREHLRGVQVDVARAVLVAISAAGEVEWGVVVGEHWYKFSASEEKKARGFAVLHEGTLSYRTPAGPWTPAVSWGVSYHGKVTEYPTRAEATTQLAHAQADVPAMLVTKVGGGAWVEVER